MGLHDVLNTARDALAAQTLGLSVTGQNVSNVNTPGYVRRQAILQPRPLGTESFGTVQATGLRRAADLYTEQRHYAAVGMNASAQESNRLLAHVEGIFQLDSGLDVGSALDELFSAFNTLSTDPSNLGVRETVIGKAAVFVTRLNDAANQVASFRDGLTQQASTVAQDINRLTRSIAEVTGKISNAEAAGHDAADLKDQRDGLILGLSELVDVRVFTNNQGQLVVQGAGTTLVEGNVARSLEVGLDTSGNLKVLARTDTGASTDVSRLLTGGKLAGIRDLHDVHTREIGAALDEYAFDVATAINAAHSSGFALDGSAGGDFFDTSAGPAGFARTIALAAGLNAADIAASGSATGVPGDGSNALALAQLREQDVMSSGSRSPTEAYAEVVRNVGDRKQGAAHDAAIREGMQNQLYVMRESQSGVNLDEEMVSLTKYQRAYEAAARVITMADELLEELINTLR